MLLPEQSAPIVSVPAVPSLILPEGGRRPIGIRGKIALASDQFYWPVRIRGVVASSQGKIVDSLRVPGIDGAGAFYLRAGSGGELTIPPAGKMKRMKGIQPSRRPQNQRGLPSDNLSGTKRFYQCAVHP